MTYIQKYRLLTEALKNKAREILPYGSRIVLYGSRARGDHKAESDWDIHILIPVARRLTLNEMDDFAYPFEKIGTDFDEYVSTSVYSVHDWNLRRYHPFYESVERDKIILLEK